MSDELKPATFNINAEIVAHKTTGDPAVLVKIDLDDDDSLQFIVLTQEGIDGIAETFTCVANELRRISAARAANKPT